MIPGLLITTFSKKIRIKRPNFLNDIEINEFKTKIVKEKEIN